MHDHRPCKGKQQVQYHGQIMEVTFERPWNNPKTRKPLRKFIQVVRLNNPRLSQDAVRISVCKEFLIGNPTARLIGFQVKEI